MNATAPVSFLENFCQGTLQQCLQGFYNMLLGIAIALAFLFVVIGSLQYLIGAAINIKEQGKKKITGAIMGLVIIFLSGVVLHWINPNIFNAELIIFSVTNLEPPKFTENTGAGGSFSEFSGTRSVCTEKNKSKMFQKCNTVLGDNVNYIVSRFFNTQIDNLSKAQKRALLLSIALNEQECKNKTISNNNQGIFGGIFSAKLTSGRDKNAKCKSSKGFCMRRCARINQCIQDAQISTSPINCDLATISDVAQKLGDTKISSCIALIDIKRSYDFAGSMNGSLLRYSGNSQSYAGKVLGCMNVFSEFITLPDKIFSEKQISKNE